MVAHPSKDDIDNWASLGNTGWDYETLSPYYQKFETHHAPDPSQAAELGSDIFDLSLHGSFGPLQVTFPAATTQLDHSWRPTFAELGLDAKDDPRRGHILGAYTTLKSIDPKGKRTTAASAFYFPNVSRANLTVVTSAHVEKIIFNYENNKDEAVAKGVIVSALGREYTVPVIGEVVLSAGTFLSPKILELSGIGSKKILQANNIPMIIENSYVGENLQVCIHYL
jgi:choline dehydrogenase